MDTLSLYRCSARLSIDNITDSHWQRRSQYSYMLEMHYFVCASPVKTHIFLIVLKSLRSKPRRNIKTTCRFCTATPNCKIVEYWHSSQRHWDPNNVREHNLPKHFPVRNVQEYFMDTGRLVSCKPLNGRLSIRDSPAKHFI